VDDGKLVNAPQLPLQGNIMGFHSQGRKENKEGEEKNFGRRGNSRTSEKQKGEDWNEKRMLFMWIMKRGG